jgi:putative oxidoreductase
MRIVTSFSDEWAGRIRSVLRIGFALLFMEHGSLKLFVFPPLPSGKPVELFSILGIAGVLEFFGGLFMAMGLLTRPVALLLAAEMACAYIWKHAPRGFYPLFNGGELALLFFFVFLYLAFAGPGAWSIDGWIRRGKHPAELKAEQRPDVEE